MRKSLDYKTTKFETSKLARLNSQELLQGQTFVEQKLRLISHCDSEFEATPDAVEGLKTELTIDRTTADGVADGNAVLAQ